MPAPIRTPRTLALASAPPGWRARAAAWLLIGAALLAAGNVRAEETGVTVSYGYNFFGELKYGPDFTHLDYVNPDAPKGGEISTWAQGSFDSMNPYTREGLAGSLSTSGYESLMTGTADEVGSAYCAAGGNVFRRHTPDGA